MYVLNSYLVPNIKGIKRFSFSSSRVRLCREVLNNDQIVVCLLCVLLKQLSHKLHVKVRVSFSKLQNPAYICNHKSCLKNVRWPGKVAQLAIQGNNEAIIEKKLSKECAKLFPNDVSCKSH